jgi:small subunit ribosomal protein S16
MTTRIRLRRMGSKKRPFYRVVVADQRSPRDGRFIEIIGKYHPLNDPSVIEIDEGRALHWLRVGAQPSDQVRNLMSKVGIWDAFVAERPNAAVAASPRADRPTTPKVSKKARAKAAEEATASAQAAAAPEKGVAPPAEASEPEGASEPEAVAPAEAPVEADTATGVSEEPSTEEPSTEEPSTEEPAAEEPSEG